MPPDTSREGAASGYARSASGEAEDQPRDLEGDVELGAVADALELDPIGVGSQSMRKRAAADGHGRSLSSAPHTIRTGQMIFSASRLQPSQSAWSISGNAASQLDAPRIWWASCSAGMCSKFVTMYCVARRRPSG